MEEIKMTKREENLDKFFDFLESIGITANELMCCCCDEYGNPEDSLYFENKNKTRKIEYCIWKYVCKENERYSSLSFSSSTQRFYTYDDKCDMVVDFEILEDHTFKSYKRGERGFFKVSDAKGYTVVKICYDLEDK